MEISHKTLHRKAKVKLILLGMMFLMGVFLLNFASAATFDNKLSPQSISKGDKLTIGGIQVDYNSLWEKYSPIKIKNMFGLGATLMEGYIDKHTESCGNDCKTEFRICNYEDTPAIENTIWYRIMEDGSRILSEPRNYQWWIQTGEKDVEVTTYTQDCVDSVKDGNRTTICTTKPVVTMKKEAVWEEYNYENRRGCYNYKITGEKKAEWTYDFVPVIAGKEISGWAVWGSGSEAGLNIVNLIGGNTGSNALDYGLIVQSNYTLNITYIIMSEATARTQCAIKLNSTGATLKTGGVSGSNCYLNYTLAAGTIYRFVSVASGSQQIGENNAGYTYPQYANGTTILGAYRGDTDAISFDRMTGIKGFNTILISSSVALNSPTNNIMSNNNNIQFNCSANVVGATLVNMSLWLNGVRNTTQSKTGITNESILTKTLNDGNYNWTCSACDSDGDCGFANGNYSLVIDTTSPTVNIIYPTGATLNGLSNGGAIVLNYSASDTHLQTCWKDYNGVNTTIASCANTTFNYATRVNSIKVWANDSVGNVGYDIVSWPVGLTINSMDYNVDVFETGNENYKLNLTTGAGTISVSANLWYNGTSHSSVITNWAGNNYSLSNSLAVPLATTASNKSFFYEIVQYNGTASNSLNSSVYWQNAGLIYLEACNATHNVLALNFTAINEDTLARVTPFSFDGTFNFWLGTGTTYKTKSISQPLANETILCISPAYKNFTVDANIEYGDNNGTYITKDYNLNSFVINNITQNIPLYMIEAADSTTFILKVQDTAQNPIGEVYIHIQRYFPGTNTYQTVQIAKTNDDGKTIGFYQAETVNYRHLLYDSSGNLLLQTSAGKVFAESVPYTLVFTIGESPEVPWSDLEPLGSLLSSIGYNNNTGIANFTYIDTSSNFQSARFLVEKVWLNQSNQVICNTSSVLSSAVITCDLSAYEGGMVGYGYITRDGVETLVELYPWGISDARQIFDKGGLFLAWFIMLVAASIFLYNFLVGMWVECAAIFLVNLIGLASFPALFVWGALALTIITTVILGGSNNGGNN